MINPLVTKFWRIGSLPTGTQLFGFRWQVQDVAGQGRFTANSKRTYIRLSTDKRIRMGPHTRWSWQVQLLAHLKETDQREFTQWLERFYPQFLPDLHFSVDTIV